MDEEALRKRLLFVPCASKEGLRQFIRDYLKLDFPDVKIDEDSTGSPMDTLWEVYEAAITGRPNFRRVMMYASRDSYKTLGAAVLEVLSLLHWKRSVVHMAAIEQQAGKAQEYVKKFFDLPVLRDFKTGDNKRLIQAEWYEHRDTGVPITVDEYAALPSIDARDQYVHNQYYIKIIVNTMQSANSDHVPFLVVDEVDVIRFPKAYAEAKYIPSPTADERKLPPITLLTSTRKSSFGLVQDEINDAPRSGLEIRHWNILDVTERCPPTRHRPDLPKLVVYRSDDTFQTIDEAAFKDALTRDPKKASKFVKDECFTGCFENCNIFAACRGRLVNQTGNASLLKPLEDTLGKFKDNSPETAQAQLMCWKPSSEGLVYPNFSREMHMLTADEMYEAVTGEPPPGPQNKESLVTLFRSRNMGIHSGMDWGFTHNFAVATGALDGRRIFIFDAIEIRELELMQKIELCDRRLKDWKPTIYPDPAYPSDIKTFRRYGYKMVEHDKDVLGGIEVVRAKLLPAAGKNPELYLLKDDEGCERLAKRTAEYHWKTDTQGKLTDVPDEKDDDLCDALRYLVFCLFGNKRGKVVVAPDSAPQQSVMTVENAPQYTRENWMGKKIEELTGSPAVQTGTAVRKGSFFADFG